MHKYFRRMATDIFLHAANVSKVVEGGRGLPCIRQTLTRYFIDMNVRITQNTNVSTILVTNR